MNDSTVPERAGRHGLVVRSHRERATHGLHAFLGHAMEGHELDQLAVEPRYDADVGGAQSFCALSDDVEDRLYVGRRTGDDLQDLAGRRLLLQGLGEVGVLGLQLGEQPRVLDGDDGLIGEGGDNVDLFVGERADLRPPHEEQSDELVLSQHGDSEYGSIAGGLLRLMQLKLRIGQDVDDMDSPTLESGSPDRRASPRADHVPPPVLAEFRTDPILRERLEHLTVESLKQPSLGPGQPRRVLDEGFQHGLEIERRAADHLEHFAGRRLLLERDPQLTVARLQLREQPHVLDGDHSLVGKGLKESNLLVAEMTRRGATDGE